MGNAAVAAAMKKAREKKTTDSKSAQGMTTQENAEQIAKQHDATIREDAENKEMAGETKDPDPEADKTNTINLVLLFDKDKNIIAESFQAALAVMSPSFAEVQAAQVDRTFFSAFTDMFRIATLISLEYGILPEYTELGSAWQAAQSPEDFVFDKSIMSPSEAAETEGTLQAMSWQEIKSRQDAGLKGLSGAQYTFFIETTERVLEAIAYLNTMKALGYQSQHTREAIWQSAKENEVKRQDNYKLQQEAEHTRKAETSKSALVEATKTGGILDL